MVTKPKAASAANADKAPAGEAPASQASSSQAPLDQANPEPAQAEPAAPRTTAKPRTFDKAVAALKQDVEVATGTVPAQPVPAEPKAVPAAPKAEPIATLYLASPVTPETEPAATHASAPATTHLKQGVTRAMKTAEQIAQFHQGNMEAIVKSGQIWASGLQDLSKHVASNAQATMEETISTFRAMTSVKSLKEAFELQSSFARASMEKAMSESSKLTETGLKLAEQAYAPITARVNAAVEVFTNRG
jgi:phasin family protein